MAQEYGSVTTAPQPGIRFTPNMPPLVSEPSVYDRLSNASATVIRCIQALQELEGTGSAPGEPDGPMNVRTLAQRLEERADQLEKQIGVMVAQIGQL